MIGIPVCRIVLLLEGLGAVLDGVGISRTSVERVVVVGPASIRCRWVGAGLLRLYFIRLICPLASSQGQARLLTAPIRPPTVTSRFSSERRAWRVLASPAPFGQLGPERALQRGVSALLGHAGEGRR